MEWMHYAQPSLFAKFFAICLRKKILKHVVGYLALFSLVIYAEVKIGFLRVGRTCENGAFVTIYETNISLDLQQPKTDITEAPPPPATKFKLLPKGESIKMVKSEILIPTAVRYLDFPRADDFTILLHGWTRHFSKSRFSCCLLRTLNDEFDDIVLAKAIPSQQNVQHGSNSSNTTMRSSEFYCSLSKGDIVATNHIADFEYVTFTNEDSCKDVSRDVIKIDFRKERVFRSVGLCVSLQNTYVNAEYLVEWLEWYRLQGALEIYFYYDHDLHKAIERIFDYYEMVGFVKTIRLRQPVSSDNEESLTFDEEMASNDCRHRMSHFDYVITLEVAELLAPRTFNTDIYDILKTASKLYPTAGVFQIHTYQVILDWKPSKKTPLHLARHELRLDQINVGQDETLSRWAYMPGRTFTSFKQRAWPKESFTSVALPKPMYALLRFIRCHPDMLKHCKNSKSKVKDEAISQFQNALVNSMREIPIDYVLPYNKRYVAKFHKVRIAGDSSFIGGM